MRRLPVLVGVFVGLGLGVLILPQTAGRAQPAAKSGDELKDALKRIGELEKKLAEQLNLERLQLPPAAPVKEAPVLTPRQKSLALIHMLKQPIEVRGLHEKVKMKTALEVIGDKLHGKLPILIDREAFVAELGPDAADPYEEEVSLPAVPGGMMPTGVALRLLLTQVGKGGATFMIRQGYIEITTLKFSAVAYALYQPSVVGVFEDRPLKNVLQDLSDESGVDIHLDPNVGKKSDMLVTATFRNTSLENALVAVTEMAELKFVILERDIYVTTPDGAKLMQKEETERAKERKILQKQGKRLEAAP